MDQPSACTGQGLQGRFWDGTSTEITSTSDALAIAAAPPSATFVATAVDYPSGSESSIDDLSTTLSQFLGSDGDTLSGFENEDLEHSVFIFTGFIRVTSDMDTDPGGPIDITFDVGSDDGFRLRIGGVTVTEFPDIRSFGFDTGFAQFPSPGEYPVELLFWENNGGTGLEWFSTIEVEDIVPVDALFQECVFAPPSPTPMPTAIPTQAARTQPNIGGGLSGLFNGPPTPFPTSQQPVQATPQPSAAPAVIRAPNTGDGGLR